MSTLFFCLNPHTKGADAGLAKTPLYNIKNSYSQSWLPQPKFSRHHRTVHYNQSWVAAPVSCHASRVTYLKSSTLILSLLTTHPYNTALMRPIGKQLMSSISLKQTIGQFCFIEKLIFWTTTVIAASRILSISLLLFKMRESFMTYYTCLRFLLGLTSIVFL